MEYFFVYGTLKRGFGNHSLLVDSKCLGTGVTEEPYVMTQSGIPFVHKTYNAEPHPIQGEVYVVDDETVEWLDALEGHPDWYKRELVNVRIVDSASPIVDAGTTFKCWLYFMGDDDYNIQPSFVNENGYYEYRTFL